MSSLGKMRKNADKFALNNVYSKMNPQQISNAIQLALDRQRADLVGEFNKDFKKLENEYNQNLKYNMDCVLNTISVELLYELADQMGYWDLKDETEEDKYIKESVQFRIQEIYINTMDKIEKYSKMKNEKQANRAFKSKREKVEKEFNIKFK